MHGFFAPLCTVRDSYAEENQETGILAEIINGCFSQKNGIFGIAGGVAVACAAHENRDGIIAKVISQCFAKDNRDHGLWVSGGGSATSLSTALDNGMSDVSGSSRTGNFPAP